MISFDVEMDAPPYMSSWRGVDEGLPKILEVLEREGVKATFFTIGMLSTVRPRAIYSIVEAGHELACHGYDHKRLDKLPLREAANNIKMCMKALRDFDEVVSFRAPNLKLPPPLLHVLREERVKIDSSVAWYKPPFRLRPSIEAGVLRVPASFPSSFTRLPPPVVKALLSLSRDYVILTHPWEYVEIRGSPRPDLTVGTGKRVVENLSYIIRVLKSRGVEIVTMKEYGSYFLTSS